MISPVNSPAISPVQYRLNGFSGSIPPIDPSRQEAATPPGKPQIKPVLQKALGDTLDGKLSWEHKQQRTGADRIDTLSARRQGVQIHMTAVSPLNEQSHATPELLSRWELKLEKPGKRPAILDGNSLHLPKTVSNQTNRDENLIPKLFKSAFDATSQRYDPLQETIERFHDKLTRGELSCSLTRIKPDFRYNLPTGAKIAQIGEGDERLEISRMGHNIRIKVHQGKQVQRHSELALQNESVRAALDALLSEVQLQRTGNRSSKGLSGF